MESKTYNICNVLSQRQISGRISVPKRGTTNLDRYDVYKLEHEEKSIYPVETFNVTEHFCLCILFFYDDDEDFLEDMHILQYDFDAILDHYSRVPSLSINNPHHDC